MDFNWSIVTDGLLYRSVTSSLTDERVTHVVVPASLVPELLPQMHGGPTSAHFSAERVWEGARETCYWPSIFKDIKKWCQ